MYPQATWGGVDWFGCDDDLSWEPVLFTEPVLAPTTRSVTARRSRSKRSAATRSGPLRRVLILDVENVCPSSRRPVRALARLHAVLEAAGPVDRVVAASAAGQHARLDQILRRAGIDEHLRCRNKPNAADRALVDAARQFAAGGDCEVLVASNDHGFRALASLPGVRRLVLITLPELATARALLRVADEHRVVAA